MPWKCSTLIIHRQTKRFSLFGFVFFFFLYHIAAAQLTILFHFLFDFTCLLCVLCDSSRYHNTPPAQTKRTHNLLNRRVNLSVCIVYLLEKSAPSVVLIVAPCTNETAIGVAWSWESDSLYFSCVFRFFLFVLFAVAVRRRDRCHSGRLPTNYHSLINVELWLLVGWRDHDHEWE